MNALCLLCVLGLCVRCVLHLVSLVPSLPLSQHMLMRVDKDRKVHSRLLLMCLLMVIRANASHRMFTLRERERGKEGEWLYATLLHCDDDAAFSREQTNEHLNHM